MVKGVTHMDYMYKDNKYFIQEGIEDSEYPPCKPTSVKMKQQDGSWVDCVIYSPYTMWKNVDTGEEDERYNWYVQYVREKQDFLDKFTEIKKSKEESNE